MRPIGLILCFSILLSSCEKPIYPGYTALNKGIHYKVEAFGGDGEKVSQGDMVVFTMSVYEGAEKGWSSTKESLIQCDTLAKGLKGLLNRFEKEDSVSIRIIPEMVAYDFGSRLDTSLGYGTIRLRIKEVYESEQWNSDMEAVTSLKREGEQKRIREFLSADSGAIPFELIDGQHVRVLEKGKKGKLPSAVEAKVIYDCYLLDGTLLYTQGSGPDEVLWYSRGLMGALIPGMEQVVLAMDLGDVVEVIMPSNMAYGTRGVEAVGIAPWTPLRFIIRLELPAGA